MNGVGIAGVAPEATLVNIRAGQDSGYFFLGPTVDALTYAADAGIDVVNMSFYVDPWLYNCPTADDYVGAPEGKPTAEELAEQQMIYDAMHEALAVAHDRRRDDGRGGRQRRHRPRHADTLRRHQPRLPVDADRTRPRPTRARSPTSASTCRPRDRTC